MCTYFFTIRISAYLAQKQQHFSAEYTTAQSQDQTKSGAFIPAASRFIHNEIITTYQIETQ
jgi:hypothetical protein